MGTSAPIVEARQIIARTVRIDRFSAPMGRRDSH
jgi:hypothetical protein